MNMTVAAALLAALATAFCVSADQVASLADETTLEAPAFGEGPSPFRMVATSTGEQYVGYVGSDYIPSENPPNTTPVTAIYMGLVAVSELDCVEACNAHLECNAASYYGLLPEASWPDQKNCFLKTIEVPCLEPEDALHTGDNTVLLMKVEECPEEFKAIHGEKLTPRGVPKPDATLPAPKAAPFQPL